MSIRKHIWLILITAIVYQAYPMYSQEASDNGDRKVSDYVATATLSDEYWPQYISVVNNHVRYPVRVDIDVVYSIVFRKNEESYEKKTTLHSDLIPPGENAKVKLGIKGNYIVRIEDVRVTAYTDY